MLVLEEQKKLKKLFEKKKKKKPIGSGIPDYFCPISGYTFHGKMLLAYHGKIFTYVRGKGVFA